MKIAGAACNPPIRYAFPGNRHVPSRRLRNERGLPPLSEYTATHRDGLPPSPGRPRLPAEPTRTVPVAAPEPASIAPLPIVFGEPLGERGRRLVQAERMERDPLGQPAANAPREIVEHVLARGLVIDPHDVAEASGERLAQ